MKLIFTSFIVFLFIPKFIFAQLPIEKIKEEIINLKSEKDIEDYWKKIYHIDQNVLLQTKNTKEYDSISMANILRISLMYEIIGEKCYLTHNIYPVVPIVALSHCRIGSVQNAYLSILLEFKKNDKFVEMVKFPDYIMECISLTHYDYSLNGKDTLINLLFDKINVQTKTKVSQKIIKIYSKNQRLNNLKESYKIGKWKRQQINSIEEDSFFEILKMNDGNIYIKCNERIQKLKSISKKKYKKYQTEDNPFNWHYVLKNDGNLSLHDENNNLLIQYSIEK